MHAGFGLFLLVSSVFYTVKTNSNICRPSSRICRARRVIGDSTSIDVPITEPILFFQNEPVPLASSVVDELTTLASTVYVISVIVVVFVLLAWITHYNAPCSSVITTLLSTVTGLPEPIIHSVALCGSCCMWCEGTWPFRRIHQFNIWTSNKIKRGVSNSCKALYDTICPCCRPLDTPSNRSLIGSLPTAVFAMINIPDTPTSSPPATVLTQPTSLPPIVPINISILSPSTDEKVPSVETKSISSQTDMIYQKRHRRPRKRAQPKQRSTTGELPVEEEQDDDESEDEDNEIIENKK